jgi:hypothetical protein
VAGLEFDPGLVAPEHTALLCGDPSLEDITLTGCGIFRNPGVTSLFKSSLCSSPEDSTRQSIIGVLP